VEHPEGAGGLSGGGRCPVTPSRPGPTFPRLTLNALTPADCGDYAALCRDVRRNRWWGYDYREEQPHPPEEWFLQASEEDYAAGRELGLAVRLRGRCIGEVVFTHFDGHGTAELGCRIAAAYAGHGYGTEAFAAALAWGLKGWDLRRVTAKCFRENHPSRHMLAACMDPTGEDETYFYFERCIQNENDMHMDILPE
jgi:RimJ/RimL family protein N-acetyltransferase